MRIFFSVNLQFIDIDQPVMWLGARHYATGLFYEPRFYGQNYNTLFEGLLAVPFMHLGMPVYYAVPLATHLIFLTPFLFTAFYLYAKKKIEYALLVAGILLCMSPAYDIMSSLPRGFVGGMFFTSFFVASLFHPGNLRFILLNTLLSYVGFLVNPNSVLVSVPLLFYLLLLNYKRKKYYVYTVIGLLLGTPVHYMLDHFYNVNPEYVSYPLNNDFSFTYFFEAFLNLNARFAHVSLLSNENALFLLIALLLLGIVLFKRNLQAFYAFLVFIFIIVFSMFSNKAADGIVWPFYSYSRLYIAMPFVICLFMITATGQYMPSQSSMIRKLIYPVAGLILCFSIYKAVNFDKLVSYHTARKKWGFVHLHSLDEVLGTVKNYRTACLQHQVKDLVFVGAAWYGETVGYGGPACYTDFPNTLKSAFERRTWRILEEKLRIPESFLIVHVDNKFDQVARERYPHLRVERIDEYGLFLVKENKQTIIQFLETVGEPVNGIKTAKPDSPQKNKS